MGPHIRSRRNWLWRLPSGATRSRDVRFLPGLLARRGLHWGQQGLAILPMMLPESGGDHGQVDLGHRLSSKLPVQVSLSTWAPYPPLGSAWFLPTRRRVLVLGQDFSGREACRPLVRPCLGCGLKASALVHKTPLSPPL